MYICMVAHAIGCRKSSSTEKIQQLKTESKLTRKNTCAQRSLRVEEIETKNFQRKKKFLIFFLESGIDRPF